MLDMCTRYFSRVSTLYFETDSSDVLKLGKLVQKINALTQVPQRISSTIVGWLTFDFAAIYLLL